MALEIAGLGCGRMLEKSTAFFFLTMALADGLQ
jgi:hypothetical protein